MTDKCNDAVSLKEYVDALFASHERNEERLAAERKEAIQVALDAVQRTAEQRSRSAQIVFGTIAALGVVIGILGALGIFHR